MVAMKTRKYYKNIWQDFDKEKHMIFVSGPRQSGKTTFAKDIASQEAVSHYFNYDIPSNKALLLEKPTFFEEVDRKKDHSPLIILDEIHKYRDWKNYLKGIYDGYSDTFRFLVTGSGRLDLSRKKGDSLAGRYLHFHLFPFTIGEMFSTGIGNKNNQFVSDVPDIKKDAQDAWEVMFNVGSFPEPFTSGTKQKYRRWAKTYHSQVIRDDLREDFAARHIDTMEALYSLLPQFVGNPFSASNHARLLKVSHKTISSWIDAFEQVFLVFRLRPYSKRISRSLLKEPKIYFFDSCIINEESFRFENMIAVELYRAVNLWTDFGLGNYKLWYLRNKEKEEVDFLITNNNKPFFAVEAKISDTSVSAHLKKFQDMLNIPVIQLVNKPGASKKIKNGLNDILVVSAANWLSYLN